jgi:hypothetical protein
MKTEVYRVYFKAGMPITWTSETPVKFATVYLPEEFLRKKSSADAQVQARRYAREVLRTDILNDARFKDGFGWVARKEEADLSEYLTPNLESSNGVKAWVN